MKPSSASYLPPLNNVPLAAPNVENKTDNGMIIAAPARTRSPHVYKYNTGIYCLYVFRSKLTKGLKLIQTDIIINKIYLLTR